MSSPNDKLAIIFSIKKINKNMYHNILYTPWDMKISPKIRKNFEKTEVSQLSKREYVFAWHFSLLKDASFFLWILSTLLFFSLVSVSLHIAPVWWNRMAALVDAITGLLSFTIQELSASLTASSMLSSELHF